MFDILTEVGSMIHQFGICKDFDKGTIIYRVRSIDNDIPHTFDQITYPSVNYAKQNRMSPVVVSMFYGAFDEE